jgi:pimeloyl-ACP methyl ester carboxylesterase
MMRTTDGVPLAAVEVGSGPRGVVLLPELSPLGLCGWWEYASYLSKSGFRVLLFDHRCAGDSGCTSTAGNPAANGLMVDVTAAVSRLRRDGASKVVLMGASQGASEALIAAARPPAGVVGVVVLSADELTDTLAGSPYPDTSTSAATQVRLPALFAVANEDPAVTVADTRNLVASVPGTHKRLLVESVDAGHGWDMVEPQSLGAGRPALSRVIIRFLRQLLG